VACLIAPTQSEAAQSTPTGTPAAAAHELTRRCVFPVRGGDIHGEICPPIRPDEAEEYLLCRALLFETAVLLRGAFWMGNFQAGKR